MLDTLDEYMRELELMEKQYGQEEELYPLINIMLRKWGNLEGCSIRTVANGRYVEEIPGRAYLGGYCAFPDIAILDEQFDASKEEAINYIYGCVEAKNTKEDLLPIGNIENKELIIDRVAYLCLKPSMIRPRYKYCLKMKDNCNENEIPKNVKDLRGINKFVEEEKDAIDWEKHLVMPRPVKKPKSMENLLISGQVYVSIIKGIEVKIGNSVLSYVPDDTAVMELIGELLWYGKVLYTNGLQWKEISILEVNGKYYDDDNENHKKEGKDIKNIIDLRNAIDKDVEPKISEIKDEIKKIQNRTDLTQEEIKKEINEKNKQIKDIYKNYNIIEKCKGLEIKVTCKTIANLIDSDVEKDVHPSSSEEEWRKLITYFVNMSWKPTEDETKKNNSNQDKKNIEAKSDAV